MHCLTKKIQQSWRQRRYWNVALLPFSAVYYLLYQVHKLLYRMDLKTSYQAPVPVIVVGNLTVGGTGKTPFVISLVKHLLQHGYKTGVISRGYASDSRDTYLVNDNTPITLSGDEPALIQQQTGVPVAIGSARKASIEQLLKQYDLDVIVSDDGLQHHALTADIEVCLQDKTTPSNNQWLLPAGPYREPINRLGRVDFVVNHVVLEAVISRSASGNSSSGYSMYLKPSVPVNLSSTSKELTKQRVHAVAGIANPQRFFASCKALGFEIVEHIFPDHYAYCQADFDFGDDLPVLMTQKDAVKCYEFSDDRLWYLPVTAQLDENLYTDIQAKLEQLKRL